MGSHSVTCHPTEVILTPLPRHPAYCRYSFFDPGRIKGWVDLGGWLFQDGLPQTVTHPSINRAQRRVTTLIETNALPLSHATTSVSVLKVLGLGLECPRSWYWRSSVSVLKVLGLGLECPRSRYWRCSVLVLKVLGLGPEGPRSWSWRSSVLVLKVLGRGVEPS